LTPQQLKKLRRDLQLTQAELATALSVSRNTVVSWEAGMHRLPGWIDYAMVGLRQALTANASQRRQGGH
jgi:DNA-binding transcriptional regulator YiaG